MFHVEQGWDVTYFGSYCSAAYMSWRSSSPLFLVALEDQIAGCAQAVFGYFKLPAPDKCLSLVQASQQTGLDRELLRGLQSNPSFWEHVDPVPAGLRLLSCLAGSNDSWVLVAVALSAEEARYKYAWVDNHLAPDLGRRRLMMMADPLLLLGNANHVLLHTQVDDWRNWRNRGGRFLQTPADPDNEAGFALFRQGLNRPGCP